MTRRHIVEATAAVERARTRPESAFPGHDRRRGPFGMLVPALSPRFTIAPQSACFTIGSCFSRNVEEALEERAMELPTKRFHNPPAEWPWRHNGLLNEYNPGSIAQRIHHALEGRPFAEETLVETPHGVLDLLLPSPSHAIGVTLERARARRAEIAGVYAHLERAALVIVTLGMVEGWFDREVELFLNRKPPSIAMETAPGRYAFRRLNVDETLGLLAPAIAALLARGVPRVLLAVSPVPFNTSFSGREAYGANLYSKSVLRVAAEALLDDHRVDYFPSYEMVTSGGGGVYAADNMHIRDAVVRQVVEVLLEAYTTP